MLRSCRIRSFALGFLGARRGYGYGYIASTYDARFEDVFAGARAWRIVRHPIRAVWNRVVLIPFMNESPPLSRGGRIRLRIIRVRDRLRTRSKG